MLSIGIVGLPNVGKSTLFNCLSGQKQADAQNYAFCTIEPNVNVTKVPDKRLYQIAKVSQPEEVTHTAIEFVDIAGLVEGAHEGEGLGNKFLSHIREVDAIAHVVRGFKDSSINHVNGSVSPKEDANVLNLELVLADLQTVSKRLESVKNKTKGGLDKEIKKEVELLEKLYDQLEAGKPARKLNFTDREEKIIKDLHLLTNKPMMYVINVGEEDLDNNNIPRIEKNTEHISVCAKLEEEIMDLPKEEAQTYLEEFNLTMSGLDKIISTGYELLNLITFFTTGEKETRAWTVEKNTPAPQAAGRIHSDFQDEFIKADVVCWKDFVKYGGWSKVKDEGLVDLAGNDYIIEDGHLCHFYHNA